jgi:DNA-binding transcriptional regulator GbsR (MarR family)
MTPVTPTEDARTLAEMEKTVIELFVRLAQVIGLQRSVGEIYGLLYASEHPLTMDELTWRLRISKGSASQGLKLLRSFGAVRTEYIHGDRRDHYVAEVEVRHLLGGFLRERMQPHLAWGETRLKDIDRLVAALPGENHVILKERLVRLKRWRTRGQRLLPMVLKLLRA